MAMQIGLPLARIELLDTQMTDAMNRYSKLGMELKPTLMLEFHGTDAGVAEQTAMFGEIAVDLGGSRRRQSTAPGPVSLHGTRGGSSHS